VVELAITPRVQGIIRERDMIKEVEKVVDQPRRKPFDADVHPEHPAHIFQSSI
jgi:hypothetical protein